MYNRRKDITKNDIVFVVILNLCVIIMNVGAILDNHCETFIGISAVIAGWIALAMCFYVMLLYLTNGK